MTSLTLKQYLYTVWGIKENYEDEEILVELKNYYPYNRFIRRRCGWQERFKLMNIHLERHLMRKMSKEDETGITIVNSFSGFNEDIYNEKYEKCTIYVRGFDIELNPEKIALEMAQEEYLSVYHKQYIILLENELKNIPYRPTELLIKTREKVRKMIKYSWPDEWPWVIKIKNTHREKMKICFEEFFDKLDFLPKNSFTGFEGGIEYLNLKNKYKEIMKLDKK